VRGDAFRYFPLMKAAPLPQCSHEMSHMVFINYFINHIIINIEDNCLVHVDSSVPFTLI